jgi:hypothetical protein
VRQTSSREDPATSPARAARRALLLGYLGDYIARGITPRNTYVSWQNPVFIDAEGSSRDDAFPEFQGRRHPNSRDDAFPSFRDDVFPSFRDDVFPSTRGRWV